MLALNGVLGWIYGLGNWLAKMMYLHILWTLFTIAGLGVFGILPATSAMFSVINKWFEDGFDAPIFKTFLTTYKKEFFKSNALGILLIGLGIFLYMDMGISKQFIQSFSIHIILLVVIFLYIITLLYFFSVFVRYDLTFFYYFKQSFLMALARPFETIAMLICMLILYYLFSYVPVLSVFVGSSLIAFPLAWFARSAFVKVEEKIAG
ncbi:putative membrane protein YesL [Virgibacillus halotolerans]|uniref:YesL family protein n=1 Tax=Virgibacillus halotolerans TaxID=1071053 RepID=UPI0019616321|nr:DUF624 domain-containing protein [Virgibacillus halotolerans]MBM7599999.1 putative membrane protein YesL [Virgibacillus halotolerans]